ncbi:30S ribosomal protein S8 [bacterium]|nr:30S ribosomal protein S8 [bacterium]
MVTDTVADFLARMQNGIVRKKDSILAPKTRMVLEITRILKEEGMIEGFEENDGVVNVIVKYVEGEPMVTKFVRISKPGQRVYVGAKEILPVMNGRGISIVSTSKGMLSGGVAKKQGIGGELICEIW